MDDAFSEIELTVDDVKEAIEGGVYRRLREIDFDVVLDRLCAAIEDGVARGIKERNDG